MADDTLETNGEAVETPLNGLKIEDGASDVDMKETIARDPQGDLSSQSGDVKSSPADAEQAAKAESRSPVKEEEEDEEEDKNGSQTPKPQDGLHEETVAGDVRVVLEPGKPPKLSRKASEKVIARSPRVFDHLPDATEEATQSFQVIKDCIYGSKYMGYSEHDSLDCDCSEDWSECDLLFYFFLDPVNWLSRAHTVVLI